MHFRFPFLSSIPRQSFLRSVNPMGSKKMTSSGASSDSPLSASDFRAYNRMAEGMEGFVSLSPWPISLFTSSIFHNSTNSHSAWPFSFNMEPALGGMWKLWETRTLSPPDDYDGPSILLAIGFPPLHRGATHIPRIGEKDAWVSKGAWAIESAQTNPCGTWETWEVSWAVSFRRGRYAPRRGETVDGRVWRSPVDTLGPRGSNSWSCQYAQVLVSCRDASAPYVILKNGVKASFDHLTSETYHTLFPEHYTYMFCLNSNLLISYLVLRRRFRLSFQAIWFCFINIHPTWGTARK